MSLLLSFAASGPPPMATGGTSIFTLTATNSSGFSRGVYGSITPDNTYGEEQFSRLSAHFNSAGYWYYTVIFTGSWAQGDVVQVDVDGVFQGDDVGNMAGADADRFFESGGNTYWQWYFSSESLFILGNTYDCSIAWSKLS